MVWSGCRRCSCPSCSPAYPGSVCRLGRCRARWPPAERNDVDLTLWSKYNGSMSTDPDPTPFNPDQILARLIEMEGVIERQKATLNALDDERNGLKNERDHFKGAFEEADAAAGAGDPAAPAGAVRPQAWIPSSSSSPWKISSRRSPPPRPPGRTLRAPKRAVSAGGL